MRFLSPLFLVVFLALPSSTLANTTGIGTDPVTSEDYSCVPNQSKNKSKIQIANSSRGTIRLFDKKKATAKTKRSLKQTQKRRQSARKSLAQSNKKLKRLQSKPIITADVVAETEATQLRINSLTTRIGELDGHIAILGELKKSISNCGQQNDVGGNFTLVSGSFTASNKRIFFYAYYVYAIDSWDEQYSRICVFDNQLGRTREVTPFSPLRCIAQDPVEGVNTCYADPNDVLEGRWYVQVDGRAGYQEPGTCDPKPWMCSFSEAIGNLNAAISGASYSFVGFLKGGQDCEDL
ncbi:MAG: hypothetical protein KDD70_05005 [Bdellovibrionales bacterium]|nr:hypothetical protein [Bdellovibrionales bacterium]